VRDIRGEKVRGRDRKRRRERGTERLEERDCEKVRERKKYSGIRLMGSWLIGSFG
jgi:hypothetical protein